MYRSLNVALLAGSAMLSIDVLAALQPEYEYWVKLHDTVGADGCTTVNELVERADRPFLLRLDVCDEAKADGLSRILRQPSSLDLSIDIEIVSPDGVVRPLTSGREAPSAEQVATWFRDGLRDNRYVADVAAEDALGLEWVWVEFEPVVIQMKLDDAFDRYGLTTFTAEAAFSELLALDEFDPVHVEATTSPLQ